LISEATKSKKQKIENAKHHARNSFSKGKKPGLFIS